MGIYIWDKNSQSAQKVASKAADASAYNGVQIGNVIMHIGEFVPRGFLLCDGNTYLRREYPALYSALPPIFRISETEFKVPDLRDKLAQGANGNLGEEIEAGIPNITGQIVPIATFRGSSGSISNNGAISGTHYDMFGNANGSSGQQRITFKFDASKGETDTDGNLKTDESTKVYGKSNTVQPPAVAINYIIKATNTADASPETINDNEATKYNVWSALKTQTEILKGGSGISLDDSIISNTSVWSSEKTNAEIAAIDNKNNYSTEERIIGTFLDKPLYRRFIYFTSPASTVQNGTTFTEGASMPIGTVSIIQDIVTCKIFRFTNNRAMVNLSCVRTSDIQFKVYTHETFTDCDAMSLEYIKTTD